jgi:hypothetical protein
MLMNVERSSPAFPEHLDSCKHATSDYLRRCARSKFVKQDADHPLFLPHSFFDHTDDLSDMMEFLVRCCLDLGVFLEPRTSYMHYTPLLYAAAAFLIGSIPYMKALIKHGANVHATDYSGRGALSTVFYRPTIHHTTHDATPEAKLMMLLDAGCDPNHVDNKGKTVSDHAGFTGLTGSDWCAWTSALRKTQGRRTLLEFEEELGIEGAATRQAFDTLYSDRHLPHSLI